MRRPVLSVVSAAAILAVWLAMGASAAAPIQPESSGYYLGTPKSPQVGELLFWPKPVGQGKIGLTFYAQYFPGCEYSDGQKQVPQQFNWEEKKPITVRGGKFEVRGEKTYTGLGGLEGPLRIIISGEFVSPTKIVATETVKASLASLVGGPTLNCLGSMTVVAKHYQFKKGEKAP